LGRFSKLSLDIAQKVKYFISLSTITFLAIWRKVSAPV